MMKVRELIGVAAVATALLTSSSEASVVYDFDGTYYYLGEPMGPVSFSFTTANFITAPTFVPSTELDSCLLIISLLPCFYQVNFLTEENLAGDSIMTIIPDQLGGGTGYAFPAGSFGTAGTFQTTTFAGGGTLTVTNTSAVPEPATWSMFLFGFAAVGFAIRRRKQTELTFRRAA